MILSQLRTLLAPHFAPAPGAALRVPLMESTFGVDEVVEVIDSLLSTQVTMGKKVAHFESAFAKKIGVKHAIMVNSGSSANLLILAALTNPMCPAAWRLQAGDEILVPAVTWATTLWPIIQVGCVPVLVDADLRTLNLDVTECERAISKKTRAIFTAHILGNTAPMAALQQLATDHKLLLIEDACEALGTRIGAHHAGNFGVATSFSFYFSHHITTMEGGMVVTNDDAFADLCRCLRAHGWTRDMHNPPPIAPRHAHIDPRFLFVNVGFNLRPTELQAAFGIHQLQKLDAMNAQRNAIVAQLAALLTQHNVPLQLAQATSGTTPAWFAFPVLLDAAHAHRREEFMIHLRQHHIDTRPILAGNLAEQPALELFPHRIAGDLPNAQAIMQRGLYWACHPSMTSAHVEHIVSAVRGFFLRIP